ncbi:MAG: LPS export ABC transporter periplasmic protein LptC [Bacteroidales bacterium]|nr:LPS export ABC transporter periplasmic protein LptC [Bacteroidales bacterium]
MKQQLLELLNKHIYNLLKGKNIIIPLVVGGIIIFFSACENDIEKVKLMSRESNFPDQSMTDAVILHKTNGRLNIKVTSPEINRYTSIEEPHTIFPQGLNVRFYDSTLTVESKITANYAIYHEKDDRWEAKNNVVAINSEGDTLNTEYLIWNQNKKLIHTDRYVRITTKDGIIHGKGFEANQDFSNWSIKNTTGTIEVEDE